MDRNSVIGLVLIGAILIVFSYLNKPSQEEKEKKQRYYDSLKRTEQAIQEEIKNKVVKSEDIKKHGVPSSEGNEQLVKQFGHFASAAEGSFDTTVVENSKLRIVFSNLGGKIYSVELKEHKTFEGKPLKLFDGKVNTFGFNFYSQNRAIATDQLFFNSNLNEKYINIENREKPLEISWKLIIEEDKYMEYIYTISPDAYDVGFKINLVNMGDVMSSNVNMLDLNWYNEIPQTEKGVSFENTYTTIVYQHFDGEVDELSARTKDENNESVSTRLKWIAFKKQFFSTFLIADDDFSSALLTFKAEENKPGILKSFKADVGVPIENLNNASVNLRFYFVPNSYPLLKTYDKGFEKVISLGGKLTAWFNKYFVINVFNWLDNHIASYGIIILILTILVKIIIFPLTYKSYMSTAKMKVLKPEIDEIGKKFPKQEDSMKKQQATMALYKKAGINPMGGCLPLLIQFPILIALFRFFPAAIELRQKSFLWADDLSSYDSIFNLPFDIPMYGDHVSLFTLLMAAALILSTKLNSAAQTEATAQMPGMKFMMNWMMPIMMVLWFNKYAAGLSYYYFLSNLITIGQTYGIRRFVDEDAIRAKLKANQKKPVKKSKWQAKLEEISKQQQQKRK